MVLFWQGPACYGQWTPAEFEIDGVTVPLVAVRFGIPFALSTSLREAFDSSTLSVCSDAEIVREQERSVLVGR